MRWTFWRRDRRTAPARGRHAAAPAATSKPVFYPVPAEDAVPEQRERAVSIGFRDGSTVEVAPDSPQGRALRAVADVLVTREGGGR